MTAKEKRVQTEENRLKALFASMSADHSEATAGLIQRAAFLKVSLEDLEKDLNEQGITELFQQGKDQKPYLRESPNLKAYNAMNSSYAKIINQLTDLLPRNANERLDSFNLFHYFQSLKGRELDRLEALNLSDKEFSRRYKKIQMRYKEMHEALSYDAYEASNFIPFGVAPRKYQSRQSTYQ